MTPQTTPVKLDLKKHEKLVVEWQDGAKCEYTIEYLRSMCPCAMCKEQRAERGKQKSRLTVLPGNYSKPLAAVSAELVGNYAMKIEWSDEHGSGIYSFEYLRGICPPEK